MSAQPWKQAPDDDPELSALPPLMEEGGRPSGKWCLGCNKPGHLTTECWSTSSLNTPEDRELSRLCMAAHAASAQPTKVLSDMNTAMRVAAAAGADQLAQLDAALGAQPRQEPPPRDEWRAHVERRLRTWKQSQVNRSGDQLALDDFMDAESLEDLIDFVCAALAAAPKEQA